MSEKTSRRADDQTTLKPTKKHKTEQSSKEDLEFVGQFSRLSTGHQVNKKRPSREVDTHTYVKRVKNVGPEYRNRTDDDSHFKGMINDFMEILKFYYPNNTINEQQIIEYIRTLNLGEPQDLNGSQNPYTFYS